MDEKEVVPALSRVLKSIVRGGHMYFRTEIEKYECIDQIKRGITLVKVCLTCKNHATFLENSELFITRAFSISGI